MNENYITKSIKFIILEYIMQVHPQILKIILNQNINRLKMSDCRELIKTGIPGTAGLIIDVTGFSAESDVNLKSFLFQLKCISHHDLRIQAIPSF